MAPKKGGKKGKRGDDDWPSDDEKVICRRLVLLVVSLRDTHRCASEPNHGATCCLTPACAVLCRAR